MDGSARRAECRLAVEVKTANMLWPMTGRVVRWWPGGRVVRKPRTQLLVEVVVEVEDSSFELAAFELAHELAVLASAAGMRVVEESTYGPGVGNRDFGPVLCEASVKLVVAGSSNARVRDFADTARRAFNERDFRS